MPDFISRRSAPRLLAGGALLTGLAASALLALVLDQPAAAADKPSRVLRHVVLYKFKPEITPAQVQEVVEAFAALRGKIDTVIALEHGTNLSQEGKSDGLTHGFIVTFRDEAGRDAYIKHPAHQEYVNLVRDRREKVIVFDLWADQ